MAALDQATAENPALAIREPADLPIETVDIGDLPFEDSAGSQLAEQRNAEATLGSPIAPLTPDEIVEQIDSQLAAIWQAVDVVPTPRLGAEVLAQKLSFVLTGKPDIVPDNERTNNRSTSPTESTILASRVERYLASSEFASTWSKNFVQQWIERSSLPPNAAAVEQLTGRIAEQIAKGQAWNQIAINLIGGSLSGKVSTEASPSEAPTNSRSDSSRAETETSIFMAALAGNGNHRLLERIGESFLDANLNCIRCHDAREPRRSIAATELQENYWGLIALLNGIDASGTAVQGSRILIDKQREWIASNRSEYVYFDLLDGRLQAAQPVLPNGQDWRSIQSASTPREALANWIGQSPLLARATVNQVWRMIYGRELVPLVLGVENVALDSREQLQEFLAGQFVAHGSDLRQLVGWIARSDGFARMPLALSQAEWLDSDEQTLAKLQRADLVFAHGAISNAVASQPLESTLLAVLDWNESGVISFSNSRAATLAQTAPTQNGAGSKRNGNPGNAARNSGEPSKLPTTDYLLHGEQHTSAEVEFVDRLLNSTRLSWEQRVDHIVALSIHQAPTGRVKQLAKQLLQRHNGDAQAAMLDLLWAVRSSNNQIVSSVK
jgi:hypothetical protein